MLGAGPPDMNQEVYDRIRETVLQVSLLKDEYQLAVERREYETVAAAKSAYYRHKHLLNEADVRHANAKLTFAQEQVLLATCQTFSAANQGLQPGEVGEVILKVWDISVSPMWVSNFLQRHHTELTGRRCKALAKKRNNEKTREEVEHWIEVLQEELDTHSYPAHAVMNVDEARFNGKTDGPMYTVIESALRGRHNHVSALCSAGFTVITFLSADGNPCLFVIILAAAFNEDGTAAINVPLLKPGRTRSGGVDLLYAFTASGYINGSLWASVIGHFRKKWSMVNPARPVLPTKSGKYFCTAG